jgi:hypothetical protein
MAIRCNDRSNCVNRAESLVTGLIAGDDTPTRLHRAQARCYQGQQEDPTPALGHSSPDRASRRHQG